MPELGFKEVLKLEDMGVSITDADKKPLNFAVGLISLAVGNMETATAEVEQHLSNGGTLDDIMEVVGEAIKDSGFFQNASKRKTKKA